MEELEKIIRGNINSFNSEEPKDGHFDRFQKKLKKNNKKEKINLTYFLKAAVIVLFISVSSVFVYEKLIKPDNATGNTYADTANEAQEVDFYYTSLLNTKYEELNSLPFRDSVQKQMMLEELTNTDSLYLNLKNDLKNNPNNEQIVSSMIHHYQLKLEIIDQIINNLKQIENINKEKEINHESTEI